MFEVYDTRDRFQIWDYNMLVIVVLVVVVGPLQYLLGISLACHKKAGKSNSAQIKQLPKSSKYSPYPKHMRLQGTA